jgi:hypothetical protein
MESIEGLAQSLGNAVGEMLANGFQLPLRFAVIANNGCVMTGAHGLRRMATGWTAPCLARSSPKKKRGSACQ